MGARQKRTLNSTNISRILKLPFPEVQPKIPTTPSSIGSDLGTRAEIINRANEECLEFFDDLANNLGSGVIMHFLAGPAKEGSLLHAIHEKFSCSDEQESDSYATAAARRS